MNEWIEHNGGPQPVADDVWVVVPTSEMWAPEVRQAKSVPWEYATGRYRILNDHLIAAARLEGIRLGLEAAAKEAFEWHDHYHSQHIAVAEAIRALNPETIAKEADND